MYYKSPNKVPPSSQVAVLVWLHLRLEQEHLWIVAQPKVFLGHRTSISGLFPPRQKENEKGFLSSKKSSLKTSISLRNKLIKRVSKMPISISNGKAPASESKIRMYRIWPSRLEARHKKIMMLNRYKTGQASTSASNKLFKPTIILCIRDTIIKTSKSRTRLSPEPLRLCLLQSNISKSNRIALQLTL